MEDTKNKGYEVDDAKKAEAEDKKEDKDIKKEEETGRSEKGYITFEQLEGLIDYLNSKEKHVDEYINFDYHINNFFIIIT